MKELMLAFLVSFGFLGQAQVDFVFFKVDSTDALGSHYAKCLIPAEVLTEEVLIRGYRGDTAQWAKFKYPTFDTTYKTYYTKPENKSWDSYLEAYDTLGVQTILNNYVCTLKTHERTFNNNINTSYEYEFLIPEEFERKSYESLKECYHFSTHHYLTEGGFSKWNSTADGEFIRNVIPAKYDTFSSHSLVCKIGVQENYCNHFFGKKIDTSFFSLQLKPNRVALKVDSVQTYKTQLSGTYNFDPTKDIDISDYPRVKELRVVNDAAIKRLRVLSPNKKQQKKIKKLLKKHGFKGELTKALTEFQLANNLPIGQYDLESLKHLGLNIN